MRPPREAPPAVPSVPAGPTAPRVVPASELSLLRRHALRAGYGLVAVGLAVTEWPRLLDQDQLLPTMDGVVTCMLVALSLLALVGVRYPVQMLPVLLFDALWKLIWLPVVALPLWATGRMDDATRETALACAWIVPVLAVIPWGHVWDRCVTGRGEPWRRTAGPR